MHWQSRRMGQAGACLLAEQKKMTPSESQALCFLSHVVLPEPGKTMLFFG